MAENVTNRDLYDALENQRKEFLGAVQRLDDKFMQLEAGRLTRAEGNITDLRVDIQKLLTQINASIDKTKVSQAAWSGKLVILGVLGMAILAAILNYLAIHLAGASK